MTDSMKPLRLGIFAVLDGAITYNSTAVPVYDEKVFTDESPNLYILLSDQQESNAPERSDCTEPIRSTINVEIVRRTGSEVSKDTIDDVSNSIYALLITSPGIAGFTVSGFQVIDVYKESAISRNVQITETQSILRKIINFVTILNPQN